MTSTSKLSISQLSLYNPSRLSDEAIIASFTARHGLFERILADISGEKLRSRAQHHLIVGQRGMGKTSLLARLAAELRNQPVLSAIFIPLVFAEEQYAVDRLSKFWLNCLDSLADACERSGRTADMSRIDKTVQHLSSKLAASVSTDQGSTDAALESFLTEAKALERRPVLLVDNLQLVFERISTQEQHVLRELLVRPGAPVLIGTSPSPPPESQDYGAAFYDHFKIHYLPPLSVDEMRQLMLALAEKVDRSDVRDRILRHPHRLDVLRQLTGGNPRTTVTLFFLYAEDFAPSVFGDLENLLDRATPLYKARFEDLSAQQQVVASAIANHWDPSTARTLAEATGLPITGISPQLDRLEKIGFIERVNLFEQSATGYQIAERFFNVWFLMRSASRRQRREVEFLTRFIESFYEEQDRFRLANLLQQEQDISPDRHLFARALSSTLGPGEARDLQRHLELDALHQKEDEVRGRLKEVIDFSRLSPVTLAFDDLRNKLIALVSPAPGVEPEEFARKVLGDRKMFRTGERERLASREHLSTDETLGILDNIATSRSSDTLEFDEEAVDWLTRRLSSGQLAALNEVEEWNVAFQQAQEISTVRLLLATVPPSVARRLAEPLVSKIQQIVRPNANAPAWVWYNWAVDLDVALCRYEEAEEAYRRAIALGETFAHPWNNLGNLFQRQGRYQEAEEAYRRSIAIDERFAYPWNGLGNLLQDHLGRSEEAEGAYRRAIALDDENASPWNNLGNLLQNHLGRYDDAEAAYLKAIKLDANYAAPWNGLGFLYCDHLHRLGEASQAFQKACDLAPSNQVPLYNLIFLHRDFLGEGTEAHSRFQPFLVSPERFEFKDPTMIEVHQALFAAYAENWGVARENLESALDRTKSGFPPNTFEVWLRVSAVMLHLNFAEQLLALLQQRGDHIRLRPWYEALAALNAGDRRHLQNLAPEIRTTAEAYYDQIEKRYNALPAKTRRRGQLLSPKQRRRHKGE